MHLMPTFFRRLLPVMLLASCALASCGQRKDCDPRPKNRCGTPTSAATKPGGNS